MLLLGPVLRHVSDTTALVWVQTDCETTRALVEAMRDKLVQDGMFFVGIDVIGDKVVEINADSAGGLQAIERLYQVDICPVVIDALERRTRNGTGTPTANG